MENYTSLGITTLSGSLNTSTVEAYQLLDAKGEMPLRYAYGAMSAFQPGPNMKSYKLGDGTENVFIASLSARATDGGGIRMCSILPRNTKAILEAAGQGESSDMNRVAAEWFPHGQCNLDIEYTGGGGGRARRADLRQLLRRVVRGAREQQPAIVELARRGRPLRLDDDRRVEGDRQGEAGIGQGLELRPLQPGRSQGHSARREARADVQLQARERDRVRPGRGARSPLVAYGPDVLHTYAAPFKSMVNAGINVSMEEEGYPWGWASKR